jgi:hypothetical protein
MRRRYTVVMLTLSRTKIVLFMLFCNTFNYYVLANKICNDKLVQLHCCTYYRLCGNLGRNEIQRDQQ